MIQVFNKQSYQMVLDENYVYICYDWVDPIIDHIKYVKDNKTIITGLDKKYFNKYKKENPNTKINLLIT
jgi:hypothetical protein